MHYLKAKLHRLKISMSVPWNTDAERDIIGLKLLEQVTIFGASLPGTIYKVLSAL